MTKIKLDLQEVVLACTIGATRELEKWVSSPAERSIDHKILLDAQIKVASEMAFTKMTNKYYPIALSGFHMPSFEKEIDVRYCSEKYLKITKDDNELYLIVMTGAIPWMSYVGWAYSEDFKKSRYVKTEDGKTFYKIPFSELELGKIKPR